MLRKTKGEITTYSPKYLYQVLPDNINCKSINLAYKEGEWYILSTEELKIDYTKKLSYCIDSLSCVPAKYYDTGQTMYDNCLDCDNN